MTDDACDVAVIGGGAAGFFAAIHAAQGSPPPRVVLLERSGRVLAKVKISGGGRCNVTHACFDPARLVTFYPRGGAALRGPFSRFQPRDTVAWFEQRGVTLKTERDGRIFPTSDQSQTIIDCLVAAAQSAGVELRLNAVIEDLRRGGSGFQIQLAPDRRLQAARLILATGSAPLGWTWAQQLGHRIEPPVPSLFTFTVDDARLKGLAGLSVPLARLTLEDKPFMQEGPLLITHWGLSGPAVLKLSAWAARALHAADYRARFYVQWDAAHTREDWLQALRETRVPLAKKALATPAGPVLFPQRLWASWLGAAGILPTKRWADLTNAEAARLAEEIQNGAFVMTGKSAFKEEFVTCGGVRLDEVDFRTLESKRCPGLYFSGEILDIDAVTGGFNFQSAWTTGWIAGQSAACALRPI